MHLCSAHKSDVMGVNRRSAGCFVDLHRPGLRTAVRVWNQPLKASERQSAPDCEVLMFQDQFWTERPADFYQRGRLIFNLSLLYHFAAQNSDFSSIVFRISLLIFLIYFTKSHGSVIEHWCNYQILKPYSLGVYLEVHIRCHSCINSLVENCKV